MTSQVWHNNASWLWVSLIVGLENEPEEWNGLWNFRKHIKTHFSVAIPGSYLLTNLLIANSALHYAASWILLKVIEIKV